MRDLRVNPRGAARRSTSAVAANVASCGLGRHPGWSRNTRSAPHGGGLRSSTASRKRHHSSDADDGRLIGGRHLCCPSAAGASPFLAKGVPSRVKPGCVEVLEVSMTHVSHARHHHQQAGKHRSGKTSSSGIGVTSRICGNFGTPQPQAVPAPVPACVPVPPAPSKLVGQVDRAFDGAGLHHDHRCGRDGVRLAREIGAEPRFLSPALAQAFLQGPAAGAHRLQRRPPGTGTPMG